MTHLADQHSYGRRRQRGGAAIEFSLVALLLFTLLLTIMDFGHLFYTNLTMQHAVREGTRYAVTGNTSLASNQASSTARCDAAIAKIREQSIGMFDNLSSQVTFKTVDYSGNVVTIGSGNCFNAGDIIVIQVDARAPVLTPWLRLAFGNQYAMRVSTTMKNEDF